MEKNRAIIARRLNASHPLGQDADVVMCNLRHARELSFEALHQFEPPADENSYLVSGWLGYVRDLSNGRRALIELVLPGDRISSYGSSVRCLCLGAVSVARLARPFARDATLHPSLAAAQDVNDAQRDHFMMQHCIRLSRMDGIESFANLLCEIHFRQSQLHEVSNDTFHFPIQQGQVSDLLGMTQAHLNRVYKQLAEEGLAQMTLHQKRIAIQDLKTLLARGHFVPPARQRQDAVLKQPAIAQLTC